MDRILWVGIATNLKRPPVSTQHPFFQTRQISMWIGKLSAKTCSAGQIPIHIDWLETKGRWRKTTGLVRHLGRSHNWNVLYLYGNINSEKSENYLSLLEDVTMPNVLNLNPEALFPKWFQQDGAPSHYGENERPRSSCRSHSTCSVFMCCIRHFMIGVHLQILTCCFILCLSQFN